MEIMVTGRKFSFEESREMDLVHDIYDSLSLDEFRQDVLDYAGRFSLSIRSLKGNREHQEKRAEWYGDTA